MHLITNNIPMDPFERHIRTVFEDAEVPIDVDRIWSAVEPTLPALQPVNWHAWRKWILGILLILISAVGTWWTLRTTSHPSPIVSLKNNHLPSSDKGSYEMVKTPLPTHQGELHNTPNSPKDASAAILPNKSKEQTALTNSKDPIQIKTDENRKTNPPKPLHPHASSSLSISNSKMIDLNGEAVGILLSHPKTASSDQTTDHNEGNSLSKLSDQRELESALARPSSDDNAKKDTTNSDLTKIAPPIIHIGIGEINYLGIAQPQVLLPLVFIPLARGVKDCYDFSLKVWRHELDVYIGPDYTPIRFTPKTSSDARYADLRKRTESSLESFSIGVQYNIRHRSGFFIGVGLNYSQIDEKFELQSLQTDTAFRNGVVRIDIDSTGKEHMQTGQKRIFEVTKWDKRTYNYYRFLSIPIVLGYGFRVGSLGVEPAVGLDINLFHKKKGEILLPTGLPGYITDGHPKEVAVYNRWAGLSLTGSLKVLYPFRDRWDLFAEPYMRYPLRSLTIDTYSLDQKRNTYGLRFGARFKF